jgi:hypothetical protein
MHSEQIRPKTGPETGCHPFRHRDDRDEPRQNRCRTGAGNRCGNKCYPFRHRRVSTRTSYPLPRAWGRLLETLGPVSEHFPTGRSWEFWPNSQIPAPKVPEEQVPRNRCHAFRHSRASMSTSAPPPRTWNSPSGGAFELARPFSFWAQARFWPQVAESFQKNPPEIHLFRSLAS